LRALAYLLGKDASFLDIAEPLVSLALHVVYNSVLASYMRPFLLVNS